MGRPKGSKNKGWTKARRKAKSEAHKKMWAEASPEKRARMKKSLNTKGLATWSHEKRMEVARKRDYKETGRKVSETRKRKIANGEIDFTSQREACLRRWNSLTPAQQLEEVTRLQSHRELKGKHHAAAKPGSREYESQQYKSEQNRLYQLAKGALKPYGIEPKQKQEIGYYRAIIEQLRPDWVKWDV